MIAIAVLLPGVASAQVGGDNSAQAAEPDPPSSEAPAEAGDAGKWESLHRKLDDMRQESRGDAAILGAELQTVKEQVEALAPPETETTPTTVTVPPDPVCNQNNGLGAQYWFAPVALEAKTSGEATAKVGLGPVWTSCVDKSGSWGLGVPLLFSIEAKTKNGSGNLFSTEVGEGTTVGTGSLGISLGFLGLSYSADNPTTIPPVGLFLGVKSSLSSYKYLESGSIEDRYSEETANELRVSSAGLNAYGTTWEADAAFAPSLELLVTYADDIGEQDSSAKWCEDAGEVENSQGAIFDLESCTTRPLGRLKKNPHLDLGLRIGVVGSASGRPWRIAAGARGWIPTSKESTTHEWKATLEVPLFVSLDGKGADKSLSNYSGIVRVTPELSWQKPRPKPTDESAPGTETVVALNVQFLGQNGFFPVSFGSY